MRAKVSIIGAGMTGATTAHWLAQREIADIVLIDVADGLAQGKALDLLQSMTVIGRDTVIVGSTSFELTKDSDIVVITAGLPRKPGMSRDDLQNTNANIVKKVVQDALSFSPKAILIILTNPLDVMTYLAMKVSQLPPQRVIGQAGILDSARMRTFVAMETGVSVENIQCYVLGGHGDEMVPLTHISNVAGQPLDEVLPIEKLNNIVERTRNGGGEIVQLLKAGSAFFAPAAALAQMVEAVLKDKHLIVPASAYLNGEYGLKDIYFGTMVQLGSSGVERIIEYPLSREERVQLEKSASLVKANIAKLTL